MKKIFFVLWTLGASKFLRLASRLPSKASYKFLLVVFPEKFTKAGSIISVAVIRNSFTITDLPTPVSPVISTLKPVYIRVFRIYLYLTVSFVGTRISKKFTFGLN